MLKTAHDLENIKQFDLLALFLYERRENICLISFLLLFNPQINKNFSVRGQRI